MDIRKLLQKQMEWENARIRYGVVTIIASEGTTSRSMGKMLVPEEGDILGTVGGGVIERMAIREARECIRRGSGEIKTYDNHMGSESEGRACAGRLQVLIEVFGKKPLLIVCGAGHVGSALIAVARLTGFEVVLVDSRTETDIPGITDFADRFIPVKDYRRDIEELKIEPGAYYVLATFSHETDRQALSAVLKKRAAYVGMLGSDKKKKWIFGELEKEGFLQEELADIHTPIGLDVANETPQEIAVGIMAEILKVKNGK